MSHDSSEIILISWFAAQETSLIIISVENSCAASYCIGTHGTILFLQDSLMNRKFKRTAFDQMNVFLLNKSINFF